MASSPELIDEPVRKTKPPITASPAFRWVVAIWFAALLGVGSLIVPVVLLERASIATGLASMLPQAAPPLGFTARALIAGVGTVGGAVLGLVLARLVARDRQPQPVKVTDRRPFSASEELAEFEELDEPAPAVHVGGRRRSLAIQEEDVPSDFLNVAPLPGLSGHDQAGDMIEEEEPAEPDHAAEPAPRQTFQPLTAEEEEQPFELDASAELTDGQDAEAHDDDEYIAPEPHFERQEFIAVAEAAAPVVEREEQEAQPAHKPVTEPLAFSPPSMARPVVFYDADPQADDELENASAAMPGFTLGDAAEPESEEDVSDKQIFDAPENDMPPPAPVDDQDGDAADGHDGEGLVQLVQRLGATLDKHREWSAEQAAATPAPVATDDPVGSGEDESASERPVLEDFDPAAADEAAEAMAAWFGSSTPAPAVEAGEGVVEEEEEQAGQQVYVPFAGTLVSTTEDEDDEDDEEIAELAASFSLPLPAKQVEDSIPRPAFDKPPVTEAADSNEDEEDDDEDRSADSEQFASLNPFANKGDEFVRIDEPEPETGDDEPAVLFPGQESRRAAAPARAFDPPAGQAGTPAARAERPKPSNDDNERALREALLNLQRMGK